MPEPKPLDQIVDAVAADPTETFDFCKDGRPVAVLVNAGQLEKLRELANLASTDLELALDAVLSRYSVPLYLSNGPDRADRGDLASDLAEVARDFFGRRR